MAKRTAPQPSQELGFGNRVTERNQRLMNRDGSSNVRRTGLTWLQSLNGYHWLISTSWPRFTLTVLGAYFLANAVFAGVYLLVGTEQLQGLIAPTFADRLWEMFFFSAQTLTTVGYGRVNPVGHLASSVAAIESLTGLLGFALATGLLYGRFSRPADRIVFSDNALIAPYRGGTALMLRLTNQKQGEFTEPEVAVSIAYVVQEGGRAMRKFNTLKLEFSRINILNATWTVVHPIDDSSPISGWTPQDFADNQSEVIVFLKGFDETFAQTVHVRASYRHDEIVHGARFLSATSPGPDGSIVVALDRLNAHERVGQTPMS